MSERNPQQYLEIMNSIQESIEQFLKKENSEDNFSILVNTFDKTKINDNKFDLLSLLHLISKIVNNSYRSHNFFEKIEQILLYFQSDINNYFSNSQIFNIFEGNKRILLFLNEEGILTFDENIVKKITKTEKYRDADYPQYFQPEIQRFVEKKWFPEELNKEIEEELPDDFYDQRNKGQNDDELCELIRNDKYEEFRKYIKEHKMTLDDTIQPSIYETNRFLIKKMLRKSGLTMIEYAAFFGSIKILNYLRKKKVKSTGPLMLFAIHSQNEEIIHSLEDKHGEFGVKTYKRFFYESLKCHHNDIANYFLSKLNEDDKNSQDTINQSLKYYNFKFLKNEFIKESSFFYLCKYDYCTFVDSLLKSQTLDVNKKEILRKFANSIFFFNILK